MDRSRLLPRICLYGFPSLAVLGALLRTLALLTAFDAEVGYFNPGPLPVASDILLAAAILAAILCACLTPKGAVSTTLCHPVSRVPTLLMGIVLAGFTVAAFILCYPFKATSLANTGAESETIDLLLLPVIFGLLSSTYYLLLVFTAFLDENGRTPDWLSAIGFLPIFWALASLAETYTNRYVAMNSPVKISLHLALIGFLLILITELRYRLGKAVPRLALCFLSIGIVLTIAGALPVLVATGAKVLANVPHTLYAAVLVLAGVYGVALLISLVKASEIAQITANATAPQPCETVAEPDEKNA